MALINAFDSGPCQVSLTHGGSDEVWTGYIAKSGTSGDFPGWNHAGSGETLSISVTSDGQVQLDRVSGGSTDNYEIDIVPDAAFNGAAIQAISLPLLYPNPACFSQGASDVNLAYSGGSGSVTPDPASLAGGSDFVGLFIGANL